MCSGGIPGRAVALEPTAGRGERAAGSLVSMVLTSPPHRRRTPRTNRSIPGVLCGRFDGGPVDVSAVDTGPRRSERVAEPGAFVTGPAPAAPCLTPSGSRAKARRP
ncbi:hypothetical protein HMPREF9057_00703 [Actinomyces sp. oral taxon 171 str. F0337]|nr:hypothetical protein HMPREF9057_00703 [Actinomyces sp. oral taxon 171 str. F0337]